MSILGTEKDSLRSRVRQAYKEATWSLRALIKGVLRRVGFLWYKVKVVEDKVIRLLDGLERKIDVQFVITEAGRLLFESEGYQFTLFWIDRLPWKSRSSDNNLLVSLLLENDCPLGTIDVFHRPKYQEKSELSEYVEEMIQTAKAQGTHSDLGEKDLLELARYVNENRIRQVRIGVVCLDQLTAEDIRAMVEEAAVSQVDAGFLFFGALSGFWNRPVWDELYNLMEGVGEGLFRKMLPYTVSLEESIRTTLQELLIYEKTRIVKTHGFAGDAYLSTLRVKGLWIDPAFPTLITENWLRDILPSYVEEKGDAIVVASTFYPPNQPDKHAASIIDQFENRMAVVFEKERRDKEEKEDPEKRGREPTFLLHDDERMFLDAYRISKPRLREDRLVFVSTKIMAQAADATRCTRLLESIDEGLKEYDVLSEKSKSRNEQFLDLRSALPIVPKKDVEEDVFPFSLQAITKSLTPSREREIPAGEIKIFIGEDLILGDAYFWRFVDTFCLLAGQQSGKTSLLELLALRLDLLLPEGASFWIYNGTDALEQDPNKKLDFGWIPIANHINRNLDKNLLPTHLSSGVFFASAYEDPRVLREDLQWIPKVGGRCVVFNALRSQQEQFGIERGFFDAYQEQSRSKKPGALFIDEVEHLAKDMVLAELVFGDVIRHASKNNQKFGWTSHGFNALPSTDEHDIRGKARNNTKKICIGTTNLIKDLAEEANINIELYPDKARLMTELVTEISVQQRAGTFISTEYGAEILEPFRAVVAAEEVEQLIRRKSEEDRIRYGV